MSNYELNFPINAGSPEPINKIAQAVKSVSDSTRTANPAMSELDAKIKGATATANTGATALSNWSLSARNLGSTLQTNTVPQVAAASAALRTLEGNLSIRAAERFITTIKGMGPVLQAAFPVFGAIAFAEVIGTMVGKVGDLYNAWNPLVRAQKESLAIIKASIPELERLVTQSEKLTAEARKRQFGVGYGFQLQDQTARHDAISDERLIGNIQAKIAAQQAIIKAGTVAPVPSGVKFSRGGDLMYDPGSPGRLDLNAQGAQEKLIGLQAQLENAILQQKNHLLEAEEARAELSKDILDKDRTRQNRIEAISKATDQIRERSLQLSDKASLERMGPIGMVEASRRAMERRYDREESDLQDQIRLNGLGGPDTVRVPQSAFDAQRIAIQQARIADRRSIGVELADAARKQAEDYASAQRNANKEEHLKSNPFVAVLARSYRDQLLAGPNLAVNEQIRRIGVDEQRGELTRQASRADLIANIANPNNPAASIAASYNIRLNLAKQIKDLELESIEKTLTGDEKRVAIAKEESDVRKATADAELERTTKILELWQHRLQSQRQLAGSLFDAAIGGGSSLSNFMRGQALGVGRTIFQNAATPIISNIAKGLHVGANSPFASLLQGTAFGANPADPIKAATDANTAATISNTAALVGVAQGLGVTVPAASTGGGGVLAAIGGSFGGGSSSPFGAILNALKGGGTVGDIPGGANAGLPGGPLATVNSTMTGPAAAHVFKGPFLTASGQSSVAGALFNPDASTSDRVVSGAASAGTLFAGYEGVSGGVKQGGARGTVSAVGAAAATAAAFDPEPISKAVLAMIAVTSQIVTSIMGDPKQNRADQIGRALKFNQFVSPVSLNASLDTSSRFSDYDRFGGFRSSPFSGIPQVEQPYFDYRNNATVPGRETSQYGSPIQVNVSTMDAKSFLDNSPQIAAAVVRDFQTDGQVLNAMRKSNIV